MPVFLLPEFLRDLQEHANPHFARRVLRRTLRSDSSFRPDADDHRYEGVDGAWIRYVSAGKTAFRVIYLRFGDNVYLFRAGEHKVEDRLAAPKSASVNAAVPVTDPEGPAASSIAMISGQESYTVQRPVLNRFRRNIPNTQIKREIFARRNLPHKDIWLVAPFINGDLFLPTATFGRLLLDQVEDGARVVIVTSAPKDKILVECITAYKTANQLSGDTPPERVIEQLIPAVELSNFANDFYRCKGLEDIRELLAPKGLSDYRAMVIFTRLVNLFVHEMKIGDAEVRRFKKAAYLFIDELDDLERASVKEAREVNDILRHIYDSCPNCFCMVIALSAEISQLPVYFFDYILGRIQRQIEMVVLDKDDAVRFVQEILDDNRVDSNGERDFFPFEKAAIETIASQLTEITPRKIVNTMQQVIEEVRLAGHNPEDGRVSADFIDEYDIIEEVLGEGGVA